MNDEGWPNKTQRSVELGRRTVKDTGLERCLPTLTRLMTKASRGW